jgi:hypothetical protein
MPERACFQPRVVEASADAGAERLAIELRLTRPIEGIAGRVLTIHLRSGAQMPQAEALRDLLHEFGTNLVAS